MCSWPFAFPLQWRMRHSLNQNDSHGQFYKTNRRHSLPPPNPIGPASPTGPACSPFPWRQERIITKTSPAPDNDALLAKGPVCSAERVWQSKYLQKQYNQMPSPTSRGPTEKYLQNRASRCGSPPPSGGDWSSGSMPGQAHHSLSLSLLTSALGHFPQCIGIITFTVEDSVLKCTDSGPREGIFSYHYFLQ